VRSHNLTRAGAVPSGTAVERVPSRHDNSAAAKTLYDVLWPTRPVIAAGLHHAHFAAGGGVTETKTFLSTAIALAMAIDTRSVFSGSSIDYQLIFQYCFWEFQWTRRS